MNTKTVERLLEGSRLHALRRHEEMQAATQMLLDLEVEPRLTQATAEWLKGLL
ncbi:MAG: hypothetical protein RLZZ156_307 [Deinococcota bacterium]|jgi:hypothetical protein